MPFQDLTLIFCGEENLFADIYEEEKNKKMLRRIMAGFTIMKMLGNISMILAGK